MMMPPRVKEIDRGWKKITKKFLGPKVTATRVGVQGSEATEDHEGMTNARLMAVHEYGAKINHPGGTPFVMTSMGTSARSGGMVGTGRVAFVSKGDPRAIGITAPHKIVIPERAPMRTTFDKNRKRYTKELKKIGERMAAGTETAEQGLNMLGEMYRADIVQRVQSGQIRPRLKAATVRAKGGETTPLLRTGQLIGSLSVDLEKAKVK